MMKATSRMLALGIAVLTPATGLAGWLAPKHTCASDDVIELLKNVHRKYAGDSGEITINAVATTLKGTPNNGDTCKASLRIRNVGPFATFISERVILYSYNLTDDGKSIYVNILEYGQVDTKTEVSKEQAEEAEALKIAECMCEHKYRCELNPKFDRDKLGPWQALGGEREFYERFVRDGICPDWRNYIGQKLSCPNLYEPCVLSGQRVGEEKKQPDYSSVSEDDPYFCTHRNHICLTSGVSAKNCEAEMKACVAKR